MRGMFDWLQGDLSLSGHIFCALSPALFMTAYFVVGLLAYAIKCALRGPHRDPEMEARGASALICMWLRLYFAWIVRPLWILLRGIAVPASAVTILAFLLAVAAGISLGAGHFALGGWLYIFSGILDYMDGRLARAQGTESSGGAALDSVLDRINDGVVLMGFAWYYRHDWVLLAALAAILGSFLVSYVRARGDGLGVEVRVGMMQRPERILVMGAATVLSPILEVALAPDDPHPPYRLAIVGLVLLAISTNLTAIRRAVHLLRALGQNPLGDFFHAGRGSLLRSLIASAVGTAADFLLVVTLVSAAGLPPWFSTIIGCGLGAATNFLLSRAWAFDKAGAFLPQASRYAIVSVTSALINGGGVGLLALVPSLDYRAAWVIVRAVVAVAWNFPLQRDYVFRDGRGDLRDGTAPSSTR